MTEQPHYLEQRRAEDVSIAWEFQEFPIPPSARVETFFGWMRDGWEFVGFHTKLSTTQERVPVVIMRRERTAMARA